MQVVPMPLGKTVIERKTILLAGLFLVTSFGLAYVGMSLYFSGIAYPSVVWATCGVALGAFILCGYRIWPAIAIGTFLGIMFAGGSFTVSLLIGATSVLQATVGTWALERLSFNPLFSRLRDVFAFIITTIFISSIIATVATLAMWVEGFVPGTDIFLSFGRWWLSTVLGILTLGALIIRWGAGPFARKEPFEWAEKIVSYLLLVAISGIIFWIPYTQLFGIPTGYAIFVPLIWIALRIGPRSMTLGLFSMTTIALSSTLVDSPDLPNGMLGTRIFSIEVFSVVISTVFMILTIISEERRSTMQKLEEHVGELEHALQKISVDAKTKTEFLAILSHELRNPLALLNTLIELINIKGLHSKDAPHLIERMGERVRTMVRILDDTLDVSRVLKRKFILKKETVEIQTIIEHSVETVDALIKRNNHTFTMSLPKHTPYLHADPVRLEQIIVNLLTNAVKYTRPKGTITLTGKNTDGSFVLSVRDNGIGIAPEMRKLIFEPFLQSDRQMHTSGTLGLGLSITKSLVELHGGSIEAHSKGVGHGSEFIVRLPVPKTVQLPLQKMQPREQNKTHTKEKHGKSATSYKVLVVDDSRDAAHGIGELLTIKGYVVELAYSGDEALRAAKKSAPDFILLDIGLPDMSGLDVARRLRAQGTPSILIALTGYGQDSDRLETKLAGFSTHLTKPVSIAQIESAFRATIKENAPRIDTSSGT